MQCEGLLLGREAVDGAVNASTLASLIRTLISSKERLLRTGARRYILRCRDGLELLHTTTRPRRLDDEGFESDVDDDTASTRSVTSTDDTISNSSSCCFVDDHVFKFPSPSPTISRGITISSSSSVATDSANSSGASDTDDVDTSAATSPSSVGGSVTKLVQSLSLYQSQRDPPKTASPDVPAESYSVTDIAFCHTDPAYPKVVVWIVKKRRLARLTCTGAENASSGLEAIVLECPNERGLRKLCASFQELSRRIKLEQYRHPHRRKESPTTLHVNTTTTLKPSNKSTYVYSNPTATVVSSSTKPQTNKVTENISTKSSYKSSSDIIETSKSYSTRTSGVTTTTHNNTTSYKFNEIVDTPKSFNSKTSELLSKPFTSSTVPKIADNLIKSFTSTVPQPKTFPKPSRLSMITSSSGGKDEDHIALSSISKFNLVQRTDGDGVTHIEVSRGLGQDSLPVETISENRGPSSIISISTPDVGNLLSPTSAKSRLCKEIEGVIRTDIDSAHARREPTSRQRQPAILVMNGEDGSGGELRKVWSPPDEEHDDEDDVVVAQTPQRPERRRYIRKKAPAPPPPAYSKHETGGARKGQLQSRHQPEVVAISHRNNVNQQKVVRGQFIRVSVDQPPSPGVQSQPTVVVPVVKASTQWVYSGGNGAPQMMAYSTVPNWGVPLRSNREVETHGQRRALDDLFTVQQKHHRRSRSSGGGGSNRSKSPPAARTPMAYRYIDVTPNSNTLSNRFFGLSQKLRELGGAVSGNQNGFSYATTGRRRGSGGDDHDRLGGGQGNLKSVIKKGGGRRGGEYGEPKKVTFSAYATVQVVD